MLRAWLGVAIVAGLTAWSMPRSAEACGITPSEIELLAPATGGTHPLGASLLYRVTGGDLLQYLVARVDDVPAAVVVEQQLATGWLDQLALVRIEPTPQIGQVVVIDRCWEDGRGVLHCLSEEGVEPTQYSIAPADANAPAAAGSVSITHEFGTFYYDCDLSAPLQFVVAVDELDQAEEADQVYVVELQTPGGVTVDTLAVHVGDPTPSFEVEFIFEQETEYYDGFCASVTAIDLSGNATLIAEECGSPDVTPGADSGSTGEDEPSTDDTTGEPASTTGDVPTDDDPTADDEPHLDTDYEATSDDVPETGDALDRGCSCRATDRAPQSAWLLALLSIAVNRRSRMSFRRV